MHAGHARAAGKANRGSSAPATIGRGMTRLQAVVVYRACTLPSRQLSLCPPIQRKYWSNFSTTRMSRPFASRALNHSQIADGRPPAAISRPAPLSSGPGSEQDVLTPYLHLDEDRSYLVDGLWGKLRRIGVSALRTSLYPIKSTRSSYRHRPKGRTLSRHRKSGGGLGTRDGPAEESTTSDRCTHYAWRVCQQRRTVSMHENTLPS